LIRTDAEGRVLAVNLDLKNPNATEAEDHRTPAEIVSGMVAREAQVLHLLRAIEALVAERA
jgi:type I restriction enzyme M protein